MWLQKLTILLVLGLSLAQEDGNTRRLRFRRPRPQIDITNPDGIAVGRPIPLRRLPQGVSVDIDRENTAQLLAAAFATEEQDFQEESDPLQNLLDTVSEDQILLEEEPIVPLRPQEQRPRTRRPPGIPRRQRPRPSGREEDKGKRLPDGPRSKPVATVERYSHTNDDGSFTFGYVGEDGTFREETRGVDCITRGKYGYIDPDGKKREFTYVSGLPCDTGLEEDDGVFRDEDDDLQNVRADPIDPSDRFRSTPAVQLTDEEIPESARPRLRRPQRPEQEEGASDFRNFQRPITRARDPATINRRPRPGQANTGALQNLLTIANNAQQGPLEPTTRPRARPNPTRRPAPRPTAAAAPSGTFDFDAELDDFTLSRPAITFDRRPEAPRNQAAAAVAAPTPVGPNFSTELVFDPASGTFKTELRQVVPGGEIRTSDPAAPAGAANTRRPAPTPSALPPTARPFTAFPSSTRRPVPAPTSPAGAPASFAPLTFPSPVPTTPRPASPTPTRIASPTPTAAARPTPTAPRAFPSPTPQQQPNPAGSFFFQPFPTVGAPRPVPNSQRPARPGPTQTVPAGTFINFGGSPRPFAPQPRPPQPPAVPGFARPTPFVPQPAPRPASPAPRPASPAPTPFIPQPAPRPATPAPRPASPAPRPAAPAPRPAAPAPRPASPVPVTAQPVRPQAPPTPTVQFGFQPIQQQQPQQFRPQQPGRPQQFRPQQAGRPFTAFANGLPPQLTSAPRPGQPQFQARPAQPQFQARPAQPQFQQARPPPGFAPQPARPQQGRPQQPGRPQQLGVPPQLQQGARFTPFGRPPPQQSSSPFTVFNPANLRGARFFL